MFFLVCRRKCQFFKNDCVKILLQKHRHVFLNYDTCYTKNIKIIGNNNIFIIFLYIFGINKNISINACNSSNNNIYIKIYILNP
jgi:hypothetical protein